MRHEYRKIVVNCVSGIYEPCGDQSIQYHHDIRGVNAITDSLLLISLYLA